MKYLLRFLSIFFLLASCGSSKTTNVKLEADYTIAFGSCNREDEDQPLWEPILANDPDLFLWGGDNVYADTDDPEVLEKAYQQQLSNPNYLKLLNSVPVFGTWDDHDYGQNDGGKNWHLKETSQQLFLDFMNVPENSPRRSREGVYHSELLETEQGSIKVIILDTRYFRDTLQKSNEPGKRYEPSEGSILGEQQ
ncbi:alkaline phosphatase family protein [Gramella sp. GC03-9]|uniref:Alkaline phosphatase family protein n=1 Tax=Christiangramia oceanisediminis TaxID=2920386 RepID=A0A9X2R9J7_9FLAO|nr:alkaline phosphatase D family protein [Gramella oceanisediminis]MCP9200917.1 alkaline phosphatase family protein [Gramella oceanisediminis]